jgi:hypothetical protein
MATNEAGHRVRRARSSQSEIQTVLSEDDMNQRSGSSGPRHRDLARELPPRRLGGAPAVREPVIPLLQLSR